MGHENGGWMNDDQRAATVVTPKPTEETFRCFVVTRCGDMPRVFAGETVEELTNTIEGLPLDELQEGDQIVITTKFFTRKEIDNIPEL